MYATWSRFHTAKKITTTTATKTTKPTETTTFDDYYNALSDATSNKRLKTLPIVDDFEQNNNDYFDINNYNYNYNYNDNYNNNINNNNNNQNNNNSPNNNQQTHNQQYRRNYIRNLWHIWKNERLQTSTSTTTISSNISSRTTTTTTTTTQTPLTTNIFNTLYNNKSSSNYVTTATSKTLSAYSDGNSNRLSPPYALPLARNYGDNMDIALIDSAETMFGSLTADSIQTDTNSAPHRLAQGIGRVHKALRKNVTATRKPYADNVVALDKSDAESGGSSFMLLFEDFGEYFYNLNGTTPTATTINTNLTDFLNRANCTNINATTNATCYDLIEGK